MNAVGILGGTFNPIHFGHLRLAQEVSDAIGLDQVRFIPAASPPHKEQPAASAKHRAAMVELAIAGNPRFVLDERELQRQGASYTIDTLLSLREELGEQTALCLLMGSDAFVRLDTWHRWQELLGLCHIVLVQRPNAQFKDGLPATLQALLQDHYSEHTEDFTSRPAGHIIMQQITALDISATRIRDDLSRGADPRYLLPDSVIDYIKENSLYV